MNKNEYAYAIARSWADAKCASTKGIINTTVALAHDAEAFLDLESGQGPRLSILIHSADESGTHTVCADYGTGQSVMDVASADAAEICYALDRVTAPWFAGDDAPLAA
jgi:hypothetical protein